MVVRSFVRKSVVILGGFKPQNGEKRFSNGYPTKRENFFFSALGKVLSSEKANKPFRELANYVS